jgi:Ca2+-binding EF-hand superfamily protein
MRNALHKLFEETDKNKDGKLVRDELMDAMGNHEHSDHHRDQEGHQNDGPSEEEIKAFLYGLIDDDGNIIL